MIYLTKIVNTYTVFNLDTQSKIPLKNFVLKYCSFGATNIAKKSDNAKWIYSGYVIAFHSAGSWSFGINIAKKVVIFVVDNNFNQFFYSFVTVRIIVRIIFQYQVKD